jgi:hypothetical protein
MATTAALDCQSKPNHIIIIGAIPTTGIALKKLPIGIKPRCKKGVLSAAMAIINPAPLPIINPGIAERTKV